MESSHTISAVYPRLGRAGLGNMLFPWARAVVWSHRLCVPLIEPLWWRPRIGPYLRGEPDKRRYDLLFRQPALSEILLDRWQLIKTKHIPEPFTTTQMDQPPPGVGILVTQGMNGYFRPLADDRLIIQQNLLSRLKRRPPIDNTRYVAFHVRLGDFARGEPGTATNTSTSIEWFVAIAKSLRKQDPTLPFIICSDGEDSELKPLWRLPNVQRTCPQDAMDDLFTLSAASLIVGSNSTFTAWASFLSQTRLILHPGTNRYLAGFAHVQEVSDGDSPLISSLT